MPTTTNFGWTTPADTDLVKDGAAAIRTLAGNIDTGLVDLKGGTTGQYLAKNSNSDLDYVWSTLPAAGGMTLISEVVASAVSGIQFTGLGSYKQLMLIWSGVRHSAAGSTFALRVNANSSNYVSNSVSIRNTASEVAANSVGFIGAYAFGENIFAFGKNVNDSGNIQSSSFGAVLIDNYTSTTKSKNYEFNFGFNSYDTGEIYHVVGNGAWNNTAAITTLDIERTSGTATLTNFTNSSIRLYGVS